MALYIEHAKTLRSPDTAEHHANRIGTIIEGMRASQATEAAAAILDDLAEDYAPATINRSLGTLKKALRMAFERGDIDIDQGARIRRLPENNERDVTLTIAQVEAIAGHASESVRACIWIAIYTGMRRGEILKLRPEDVQTDALVVRKGNTKTLQTRLVPIIEPLRPWLAHVPVPLTYEGLKTGWGRARIAAKMPWATFHDLRRSCGSLMIQAGADLYTVSKVLGHSTPAVTAKRYAHMQISQQAEALRKTFG
ncbi:MAG: site-specific integrase [Rhodospirillales bacterium]|nr:site-specific integrase [Rhodospirillales bacterium]